MLQALLMSLPYRINENGAIQTSSAAPAPLPPLPAAPTHADSDRTMTTITAVPSSNESPSTSTSSPLDMLIVILRNTHNAFPPELAANACALLVGLATATATATTGTGEGVGDLSKVKQATRGVLESIAAGLLGGGKSEEGGPSKLVQAAANRTLEVWAAAGKVVPMDNGLQGGPITMTPA